MEVAEVHKIVKDAASDVRAFVRDRFTPGSLDSLNELESLIIDKVTDAVFALTATKANEKHLHTLRGRRATMLDYLKLRFSLSDWHGVQDAASDIREIEAQITLLTPGGSR